MIKFISFDLDDTLIDRESFDYVLWHQEIPKLYAKQYNISIGRATEIVFKEYYKMNENKKGWTSPAFWFKKFRLKANHRMVLRDLSKNARLFPEVKMVLHELSKKYRLVVLTKSAKEFIDLKLKVENIRKYFDYVFSTLDHFGTGKKGVYVYRGMLKRLKAEPDEVIHVGDDFQHDYKIPSKIGIKAIFLDRSGRIKRFRTIHSLKQLKRHLNEL